MDPTLPPTETAVDLKEVTEQKVVALADKIAKQARMSNSAEPKPLNWSEWSTSGLEPQTPIKLGDLKAEFPDLVKVLETPSGEVEVRRDRVDDNTTVSTVGFWRNPDGHYSAVQFTLNNEGDPPRTIRRVNLEAGATPRRTWENIGWIRNSKGFAGPDSETFLKALDQADQLADKIVDSGTFNAFYSSHEEKVGKANWEKVSPSK